MKTGKATAPPPMLVPPATIEPKIIVTAASQLAIRLEKARLGPVRVNHTVQTVTAASMLTPIKWLENTILAARRNNLPLNWIWFLILPFFVL